jgi:uncharacterized damage-inducible protein DinB
VGAPPLDEFLVRHAPGTPLEVPEQLVAARRLLRSALHLLASIPDGALERPWAWRGDEADVRYGLYRQYEALEHARADVTRRLAQHAEAVPPAQPMLAAADAARWDLHGLLAGLDDSELDRSPGGEEWSLRQTLAHIVAGQRGYNWGSAWWLSRRSAPVDDFPQYIPESVIAGMPAEEAEGEGSIADILARLDDVLDQGAAAFANLADDELAVRARWSGIAVDLRFRLGRWSSHIREHAVQVEKTLVMLGLPMSEVERVTRLIAAAYGRLEAEAYARPHGPAVADAVGRILSAASAVATDAEDIARSAGSTGRS